MGSAIPPLTVGMPVYNAERHLAEAIESILVQTYSDFEFVISDNASTDATQEICRAYAASDQRIAYSRLPENRGAAPNFNRVFLANRSPLFKFAASDDVCAPRFLEACVEPYHHSSTELVLCFPTTIRIDEIGTQVETIQEHLDLRQVNPHERFRAFLLNHVLSNCFYGVIRSAAYASTRLHKAYDAADVVLLSELALRGQFWQLDEPLFMRRFHKRMSHKANPTGTAIRAWYDSSQHGHRTFPRTRMFWEFLRAVDAAPISTSERLRCRRELLTVWLPKKWKTILREAAEGVGIAIPGRGRTVSSNSASTS